MGQRKYTQITKTRKHETHLQNVGEGDLCRPISLECVDADVAVGGHVGVVDLRQEEAAGRRVGEVVAQDELDVERAAVVRRPDCCVVVRKRGHAGQSKIHTAKYVILRCRGGMHKPTHWIGAFLEGVL